MVPVNLPLLNGNEREYLIKSIDDGWISSEGPAVKSFEQKFSERVDRRFGVAVCNGTAALEIAIKAIGIGEGDEVIMPTFTIISPAAAIVKSGGIPVLVDSDPLTWNMNVSQIEEKITAKTKAILVVHIYGLPVDMDPVLDIATRYHLKVVEDAAEMHGQLYKGKPCGSFGDISTFSFYANKIVTTGEGGMIVCNDKALAERCALLRNLSFNPERRFVHEELGWNYRFTQLQAVLGLAQLERLDEFVQRKRMTGKKYNELLSDLKDKVELPLQATVYADNIYWVYGLILKDTVGYDAREIIKKLAAEEIGSRPFFYPMHQQPVFNKMNLFANEQYTVAETMSQRGFYIPSGLAITEDEIIEVSDKLHKILNG